MKVGSGVGVGVVNPFTECYCKTCRIEGPRTSWKTPPVALELVFKLESDIISLNDVDLGSLKPVLVIL